MPTPLSVHIGQLCKLIFGWRSADLMMENKKLKILCLHGCRQNKTVFREKLGQFRKNLKQHAEFHFIEAPHSLSKSDLTSDTPTIDERSWWFTSEDNTYQSRIKTEFCIGLDESLKLIEKTVVEDGPFDGILGFSQGAAFTALLCGLLEKNKLPFTINFVIIVAGFKSLYDGHADLYESVIKIPSLHVIGETDEVIHPDRSKALLPSFDNSNVIMHPGGHYVPASKELKEKYIKFLDSVKQLTNS